MRVPEMLKMLALVGCVLPSLSLADVKLGYVDIQRALTEVNEGREAKERLKSLLEKKQKELDREQQSLQREGEQLEKQASMMNEEARLTKQNQLREKFMVLAQKLEKGKMEMASMERTELDAIFKKMDPIIAQIAQREGLTMVFEKTDSGLVYAQPSLDLTNELVRIYNDRNKSAAKTNAARSDTPKK